MYAECMSILRFGTCSWKYPSWKGLVYSATKGINYLREYSRRYRAVEIDQWFWSLFDTDSVKLPVADTVAEYLASVDEEFRFTIKAPNAVTLTHFSRHAKQRRSGVNPYFLSASLLGDFLSRIAPMRERTACVILQFEYLNRQKMSGLAEFCERIDAFLTSLRDVAGSWPLGVEIRNPNYLEARYFETLARHRVPHVFCHGYYLPPAPLVYEKMRAVLGDSAGDGIPGPGVIRLLGPDRKGIEEASGKRWDRVVAPRDEELPQLLDVAADMLGRGLDVYVNVNNHYEGSAPLTIEKLERLTRATRDRAGS